jgi:alginate O-acetyltransferase complex protein AlgI
MVLIIIVSWFVGRFVSKSSDDKKRKRALILGICLNLLALVIYKYLNFIVANFNLLHLVNIKLPSIALPLGISFYIFQSISYLIDIYRRRIESSQSFINFAAYISLFPQLVAGPIVRYENVARSFADRKLKLNNVFEGLQRFAMGLAKKILIADTMALIADNVFNSPVSTLPFSITWLGAIAYTLQIYFDFSGYSDMAIGLGRIFNFKFLENFKYPYSSKSITEFWRRWHISLSSFFRDYLYIPLGGNRKGKGRTYVNLFIVFLLCGLWHGAAWNFLVWGIYQGFGLIIERLGFLKVLKKIPAFFANIYVWFFVLIGWIIFRANTLSYAFDYIKIMFSGNKEYPLASFYKFLNFGSWSTLYLLILGIILSYPVMAKVRIKYKNNPLWIALLFCIFVVAYVFSITSTFVPFIYFRF